MRRLTAVVSHLSPPPSSSLSSLSSASSGDRREMNWKDLSAYPYNHTIQTRWADQDCYGHVNNKEYYSFIDTVVNKYLIEKGGLDITKSSGGNVGYVVRSECDFVKPMKFLQQVKCGMKVEKIGTSSVTYRVGLFTGEPPALCGLGRFVHVFVGPDERPAPLDPKLREALLLLL
mmetsp:Transcript_32895/g.51421  ORF Transcript_32895/g.51421 Transcript_32895/m.51421 type:complete len:174 (-) Transcript_32895:30-551(-)